MMKQYQIVQIKNGWLVTFPAEQQVMTPNGPQMGQPTLVYCEDYAAVVNALKANWPIEVS